MGKFCNACGFDNDPLHVYCRKCGNKLPVGITAEMMVKTKKPRAKPSSSISFVLMILLCMVVLAVNLALWEFTPKVEQGIDQDFERARQKISRLENAGFQGAAEVFSESEVNAYMRDLKEQLNSQASFGWIHEIQSMMVDLQTDQMVFTIATRFRFLHLTWEMAGIPQKAEKGFTFSLQGGKIGHLPVLGLVNKLVVPPLNLVFLALRKELTFIEKIDKIKLEDGFITASISKKKPSALEKIKALMESDTTQLDVKNADGDTLLHLVIRNRDPVVVEYLLIQGAEPDARNNRGQTPLHRAAYHGQREIAVLLLSKGVDVNAKDDNEETPLDWANYRAKLDMVAFLKEHGGKTGEELIGEKNDE